MPATKKALKKTQKKVSKVKAFTVDCTIPADDGVLNVDSFVSAMEYAPQPARQPAAAAGNGKERGRVCPRAAGGAACGNDEAETEKWEKGRASACAFVRCGKNR